MAVVFSKPSELRPALSTAPRAGLGRIRKIGLLGSHSASLEWCPWDDPTWELWGHSSSRGWYKRAPERYFDLHRKECWTRGGKKGAAYPQWLGRNTVPIYMQDKFPEVPASVRYPKERVQMEFRSYISSHAAWMIALALMEGVTHIGFFGVSYTDDDGPERFTQRGSTEYWMGFAEGRGVQLVIPKGCTLLQQPQELYGYESHDDEGKLVPAYQSKYTRIVAPAAPSTLLPNGMEAPPADVVDAMNKELAENTLPDFYLGPKPEMVGV